MMFPFSLFKKRRKEETPLEKDFNEPVQQGFQSSFKEPNFSINEMRDDLILSKIETINAKLDNVIQRLERIERLAKE